MSGHQPSERTPLLQPTSALSHADDSAILENDAQTAEVVGQGALEAPQFPQIGKPRSRSHSPGLGPDEDSIARSEPDKLANFGENGILAGIGKAKFWFVFGGILMGYFVSSTDQS